MAPPRRDWSFELLICCDPHRYLFLFTLNKCTVVSKSSQSAEVIMNRELNHISDP